MERHISTAAGASEPSPARLPYLPGLDGLRALAVIGVLLYHADLSVWGGFLGVESFFVISGFLITSLLAAEWRQQGRIDLRAFWLRRARRLLPALFVMLAGALILVAVLLPSEIAVFRSDLLAALGYVMNWHLVFSQQSYFDAAVRPSLLQHLWSLAIEEQFYLLWPLLFIIGRRALRASGLLIATIAAAAASSLLLALLYEPGADPSRIYYGTDTRAGGLLLGAALALVWAPGHAPAATRRSIGLALDVVGLLALGGLIASYAWVYDYHPLLYRGGFAMVALGTAIAIVAATHPRAHLVPSALSWGLLRWIGLRSYGIYLWHWPIFQVTRPYVDLPIDGWPLVALRLAIVLALAGLSYRFVEMPVRRRAIERAWQAFWSRCRGAPAQHRNYSVRWRWLYVPLVGMLVLSSSIWMPQILARSAAARVAATTTTADSSAMAIPGTAPVAALGRPPRTTGTTVAADTTTLPATPTTPQPAPDEVAPKPFDPALAAELQRILDTTVADGRIPGVVLAVQVPGQQPWAGASGIADRRTAQPMQPDTRVRIGSLSKMFTAVAVLQLAEEGAIDLDAPIATWLPDLVPDGHTITVRQLLQHTSGLYDYLEDRQFVNRTYRDPARTWTPEEVVAYATKFPLEFRPGAAGAWNYSSTNYVLLGMIVQKATGNTLAQELRQRVFDPLGMKQTFSAPDEAIQGVQARGYSDNIDRTDAPMSFVVGTANIVSTASDMQVFAQALFKGQLLKPDTQTMTYQFVNGKGRYKMPDLEYGLGLMRNRLPVGPGPDGKPRPAEISTVLGHIGGYGGFRSAVWTAPESGITVALGVNQADTDPNIVATKVFDAILRQQGR